jgi:hypothetical protein
MAVPCRIAAGLGLLGVAAALAGCAMPLAGDHHTSRTVAQFDRLEIGADVAQLPLPVRLQRDANDPAQFSGPSYGTRPADFLAVASAPMTDAEADALIVRAITEHEMRRP